MNMTVEELDRLIAIAANSPFQRRLAAGYARVLAVTMARHRLLTPEQLGDVARTLNAICPEQSDLVERANG